MSNQVAKLSKLDPVVLLLAHMVCADRQIHSEEARYFRLFAEELRASPETLAATDLVLADNPAMIPFGTVCQHVPSDRQDEALRKLLTLAYSDGHLAPPEEAFLKHVVREWQLPPDAIETLLREAAGFADHRQTETAPEEGAASWGTRLLQGVESSSGLLAFAAKLAPKQFAQKIEHLRRQLLLAGPEYDEAIAACAHIAAEDCEVAEQALAQTEQALFQLGRGVASHIKALEELVAKNGQGKSSQDVFEVLRGTEKALQTEALVKVQVVRKSHGAKQRALKHYSIAFMGRTKAGKSTLHAVIAGEGWEAIGVGAQRTTRLNRIYDWKNLRIIDTPGIGAPGGESDEAIAESIIDEADVIVYVLTNDSQQQAEFHFLRKLKARSKPLVILLNVKQNLADSVRLRRFLENPGKTFEMDGPNGLNGHMQRIRRYAKDHYANTYFDIIPVQLLAAQLSRQPEHEAQSEALLKASRLPHFLDALRVEVIENGALRRSQTFLGATVGDVEGVAKWIQTRKQDYENLTERVGEGRRDAHLAIDAAGRDATRALEDELHNLFQSLASHIGPFAEDHWTDDEAAIKQVWKACVEDFGLERRVQQVVDDVGKTYQSRVQDALEEVGKDFLLIGQLGGGEYSFAAQDSSTLFRNLFKIGGALLQILSFVPGLGVWAWAARGVGFLAGLLSNWFESREEKQRKAIGNISTSLRDQLKRQEAAQIEQAVKHFRDQHKALQDAVDGHFEILQSGITSIAGQLNAVEVTVAKAVDRLNLAFGERILAWAEGRAGEVSTGPHVPRVKDVTRDFGRHISLMVDRPVNLKHDPERLTQVLQEDVSINVSQSTPVAF